MRLVVTSFDMHRFLSVSETGAYTILFVSPDMCPAFMEAVRYKDAHNHVVRDVRTIELIGSALDMLADDSLNEIEQNGYVNTLRLKNAVMMMRDENNNITECAMASGFGSMRTFYRAFAEEFGCAPRDYLKHIKRPNRCRMLHT